MKGKFHIIRHPDDLIKEFSTQLNLSEFKSESELLESLDLNKEKAKRVSFKICNLKKYSEMVEDLNKSCVSSTSTIYDLNLPSISLNADQSSVSKYYKFIIRDTGTKYNLVEELCVNSSMKLSQFKKLILCKYDGMVVVDNGVKKSYSKTSKTFYKHTANFSDMIITKGCVEALVKKFEKEKEGMIIFNMKCAEHLDCFHSITLIEEFYKTGILTANKDFTIKTKSHDNIHLKCDYCKSVYTNYQQINSKEGMRRIENICNSTPCKVMRQYKT